MSDEAGMSFTVEDMTIEPDGTRVIRKIKIDGPVVLQFKPEGGPPVDMTPHIVQVNETPLLELGGRPVSWFERWIAEKQRRGEASRARRMGR